LLQQRLQASIEPLIESLGYELVLLEFVPTSASATLRLYIDNERGVTLDDCEVVSREVAAKLDVEDPIRQAYRLEVSSPGWERPLVKAAHYRRFIGEQAKLFLTAPVQGRKRIVGRLVAADEQQVVLETELGSLEVCYADIDKAHLVPDYAAEMKKRKA